MYVQSDLLLLADVFENTWQACLKMTGIKLELGTNIDMLLMVEKEIRGGICHAILRYPKANNKYMKNYNINKESSYTEYLDAKNLYGWAMSQKLPVKEFKWARDTPSIDKKTYNDKKL